jgi:hypothetical protein
MMLQAMWIVDSAYGYLKSTFAKAALFKMVTRILLCNQVKRERGGGGGGELFCLFFRVYRRCYKMKKEQNYFIKLTLPSKPTARTLECFQMLHPNSWLPSRRHRIAAADLFFQSSRSRVKRRLLWESTFFTLELLKLCWYPLCS